MITGDVPVPERVAALAHGPPDEPAGPGVPAGTTQRHAELHRAGRSRPGRSMVGRLAESMELTLRSAARCSRGWFRAGVPRVAARRRGASPGPPSARHDPRWPPPVPGDGRGRTASSSRPTGRSGVPRGRRPRCRAAGQHVPPRPSTPTASRSGFATCRSGAGTSPRTLRARSCGARPGAGGVARRARGLPAAAAPETNVLGFAVPLELASPMATSGSSRRSRRSPPPLT